MCIVCVEEAAAATAAVAACAAPFIPSVRYRLCAWMRRFLKALSHNCGGQKTKVQVTYLHRLD